MNNITGLNPRQRDALRRVAEKGLKNAAVSLSQMVESRVGLEMAMVDFLPLQEIPKRIGGPETLSMGVYLRMMGDLGGTSLLILSRESALSLVDLLYARPSGETEILSHEDRSALGEVGNVITAACLTEIGNFLDVTMYHSPPCIVFDMAKSLIDFVLRGMNGRIENVLVIQVRFKGKKEEIKADFIFLLDSSSISTLLNKLDKKLQA